MLKRANKVSIWKNLLKSKHDESAKTSFCKFLSIISVRYESCIKRAYSINGRYLSCKFGNCYDCNRAISVIYSHWVCKQWIVWRHVEFFLQYFLCRLNSKKMHSFMHSSMGNNKWVKDHPKWKQCPSTSLGTFFFLQIFILQCDSITMQKCRVLCVNVAIVMNEKHNNRSGNSFRAHHRSSKIFIRFIWQDLQMQYEILIKERWACEMKKKKPAFQWWKRWKQLLSFAFFVQIHQYAIIHSWHREFSLLCPAFNICFFSFFLDQWKWIATQRHLRQHELMFLSFHSSFIFCTMNELQWRLNGCTTDSLFITKIGFSRIPNHLTHSFSFVHIG